MRNTRIITALVAAFTALVLGFANAPAGAATLPQHTITNLAAGEATSNHFYVKGNATTAKGHIIILQKAPRGTSNWSFKASTRAASNSGFFRINFTSPTRTCFRILVKATKTHRTTTRKVGCVVAS